MITQEERNNLRQVVEYSKSGVVKVIPLPWQTVEILLNALEVAEARVSDVETSLVRAQNTISEQCAGIDKIATANHALAAEAKKTEAENARLTAERDWLAMYAVRDVLLPYQPGLLQSAEKVKEAARRAVAAGDGEQRPLSIKSQK